MARESISVGTVANDGTGDPLRTAFIKANDNFIELYALLATRTTVADADHTITAGSEYWISYTSLTASRTVTLPAANSVEAGVVLWVGDESGNCTSGIKISITRAGSDVINKIYTTISIKIADGILGFKSNGVDGWVIINGYHTKPWDSVNYLYNFTHFGGI